MSQWGQIIQFEGSRFVPHVRGAPFEPIAEYQLIDAVIHLDECTADVVASAQAFVGKPYREWLDYFVRRTPTTFAVTARTALHPPHFTCFAAN